MKVYYDFQILSLQKYGGISRYFFELINGIRALGAEANINCLHSRNYYFKDLIKIYDTSKNNNIINTIDLRLFRQLNRIRALMDMRKGYDIIHPTYYSPYMLGRHRGKLVITVYDMIQEKFGGRSRVADVKSKMLHAADHIIAISENTKKDVLDIYPDIKAEKVSVIYLASSMTVHENSGTNPLGRPYVLFVGGRNWYKNFVRFAKAMRPILKTHPDLCVFCVGGGGVLSVEELNAVEGITDRFYFSPLDDNALANAYKHAECFVFPSEYEGFGIPVLESFACSCPLVCSNSSSFPEVAGDAAEYVDPYDVDDMSAKILRVIEDTDLREQLKALGRERLKQFSWNKTAQQTLECYSMLIGQ